MKNGAAMSSLLLSNFPFLPRLQGNERLPLFSIRQRPLLEDCNISMICAAARKERYLLSQHGKIGRLPLEGKMKHTP